MQKLLIGSFDFTINNYEQITQEITQRLESVEQYNVQRVILLSRHKQVNEFKGLRFNNIEVKTDTDLGEVTAYIGDTQGSWPISTITQSKIKFSKHNFVIVNSNPFGFTTQKFIHSEENWNPLSPLKRLFQNKEKR